MEVLSIDPTFQNLYFPDTRFTDCVFQTLERFRRELIYSSCRPVRADKLFTSAVPKQRLSTSFPELDGILQGGLLRGSITEFAGPTNTGKTVVCVSFRVELKISCFQISLSQDSSRRLMYKLSISILWELSTRHFSGLFSQVRLMPLFWIVFIL